MTKRDWTLLAIAAAQGEPLSPVQLQKVLFLLGEMKPKSIRHGFYKFKPYNYGPFDATIYKDAESLAEDGLVSIQASSHTKWVEYSVTPKGAAVAQRIAGHADQEAVDYLRRVVEWARGLSFQDLVRAIYARFPKYRANSVFQD